MTVVRDLLLDTGKFVGTIRIHEDVRQLHSEEHQALLLDKATVDMLQRVEQEGDIRAYSWDVFMLDAAMALQRQTKQHKAHRAMIDRAIGK